MKALNLLLTILWTISAIIYGFGYAVAPAWYVGCICGLFALEDFFNFLAK